MYELHVRDFSASDVSVPAALRGKYAAFSPAATGSETAGQAHLTALSASGLTHVHLLPSYDFGSVPERAEEQLEAAMDLAQFAPGMPRSAPPHSCAAFARSGTLCTHLTVLPRFDEMLRKQRF